MMFIYGTSDVDWMGDKIINNNITRHHIVKKADGGEDHISNYALLTPNSHHLLNYLEDNYVSDFNQINALLLKLNRTEKPPTKEYYEEMNAILKRVRKKIKNERRGRSR